MTLPAPSSSWRLDHSSGERLATVTPINRVGRPRKVRPERACLTCGRAFVGHTNRVFCRDACSPGRRVGAQTHATVRYKALRAAGLCVQCKRPTTLARCERCADKLVGRAQ